MKRKTDKRLIDELPDVAVPPPGYGQRQLAVIEKLFQPDMPDGELINLYFLLHDWHDDDRMVFGARFKQIEDVLIERMSGRIPDEGEERSLSPGFDPEEYREATETACSGLLTDWQILELSAIALVNRGDDEAGPRWEAVADICRAQILRRIKRVRLSTVKRSNNETLPHPGSTPSEIEAWHHANEEYGRRIQDLRGRLGLYEDSLAEAICRPANDIKQVEEGSPTLDPRMILAALTLAADYYPPEEHIFHTTSRTFVAHFYEAARRMKPKVREIWLLTHADGLTVAEIADWQNLSTSMVTQRLREGERDAERFGPQPPKPSKRKLRGPKP